LVFLFLIAILCKVIFYGLIRKLQERLPPIKTLG
jgi:hypothetical protein